MESGQQPNEDMAILDQRQTKIPKRYKVLLHNDDYTTMEFVVTVLRKIFHHSFEKAQEIMLQVHKRGVGVCGVYTHEVAEAKVVQVRRFAKSNGFPLKATMEPE